MLKSAPDAHLPTVVGRLHKLAGVSPRHGLDDPLGPGEAEALVAALLDVEPAHITNARTRAMRESALVTYAGAREVAAPARLSILEWMAKNQHPELPKVIARWLVGEPDADARESVRRHANTEWGDYGREALREAERINARKAPGRRK